MNTIMQISANQREKRQNAARIAEKGKTAREDEKRDTGAFRAVLDNVNKMKGRVWNDS